MSHRDVAGLLTVVAVALASAHILTFAYIVTQTIAYPFQLEWMDKTNGSIKNGLQIILKN